MKHSSIINRLGFLLDVERVNINDPLVWPLEALMIIFTHTSIRIERNTRDQSADHKMEAQHSLFP